MENNIQVKINEPGQINEENGGLGHVPPPRVGGITPPPSGPGSMPPPGGSGGLKPGGKGSMPPPSSGLMPPPRGGGGLKPPPRRSAPSLSVPTPGGLFPLANSPQLQSSSSTGNQTCRKLAIRQFNGQKSFSESLILRFGSLI